MKAELNADPSGGRHEHCQRHGAGPLNLNQTSKTSPVEPLWTKY